MRLHRVDRYVQLVGDLLVAVPLRQQTQDLNRNVQRSVDQRNAADAAKLARYREAAEAYERRRAEWRRRVAACEDGDDRACSPY